MPCPWIGFEVLGIECTILLLLQEASSFVGDDMEPNLGQQTPGQGAQGDRLLYKLLRARCLFEELFLHFEALVDKLHQLVMLFRTHVEGKTRSATR